MYTWKKLQKLLGNNVGGALCKGYTRKTEQFLWKDEWKITTKTCGSSVNLETMKKLYRGIFNAQRIVKKLLLEGSFVDNEETFTQNLCDIHTKEGGKISFRKCVKNA